MGADRERREDGLDMEAPAMWGGPRREREPCSQLPTCLVQTSPRLSRGEVFLSFPRSLSRNLGSTAKLSHVWCPLSISSIAVVLWSPSRLIYCKISRLAPPPSVDPSHLTHPTLVTPDKDLILADWVALLRPRSHRSSLISRPSLFSKLCCPFCQSEQPST